MTTLTAPTETLTVIYGAGGAVLPTCSTACLAGLAADLAGRARQPVAGRRH